MARLGGVPIDLAGSSDTDVDTTATDRSGRVRAYNADTVPHVCTFKIGGEPFKKITLQVGEDAIFGPENAASGEDFSVNVAEAITTTAVKAIFTGEDES